MEIDKKLNNKYNIHNNNMNNPQQEQPQLMKSEIENEKKQNKMK